MCVCVCLGCACITNYFYSITSPTYSYYSPVEGSRYCIRLCASLCYWQKCSSSSFFAQTDQKSAWSQQFSPSTEAEKVAIVLIAANSLRLLSRHSDPVGVWCCKTELNVVKGDALFFKLSTGLLHILLIWLDLTYKHIEKCNCINPSFYVSFTCEVNMKCAYILTLLLPWN